MSIWFIIVAATGLGGALALWYTASRTKHCSEEMLAKYAEMLARSRAERIKELAAQSESSEQRTSEPIVED